MFGTSQLVILSAELHVTAKTQDVILNTDSNVTPQPDVPPWQPQSSLHY